MSKRLIIILALAFVVGLTIAAYAEVQNVKVSGDITVMGVARDKLTLESRGKNPKYLTETDDFTAHINAVLSQVRLRVDADLTDNVSATVRLLNERPWGMEADSTSTKADNSEIDLDLAYATLKEFLYSPLTLTIGRQELHFGNDLIIGDIDTNGIAAGHGTANRYLPNSLDDLSLRKSFDAARATLNYDPLVIDAVYAKVDENNVAVNDDVDLYGVNANYALDKSTTLEAYYWEKRNKKAGPVSNLTSESTDTTKRYNDRANDDVVKTFGARAQYDGIKNLSLGFEGAYQFGVKVNNTTLYPNERSNNGAKRERKAFALQTIGRYNLSDIAMVKKYTPVLSASYTLLSGNKHNQTSDKYSGWASMFENQAGGTLFNKILGYSNAQLISAGVSVKPLEDVKLSLDYYNIRLVKTLGKSGDRIEDVDAVNLSGVAGDPTYVMKPDRKGLGNEVDATLTYDYTEDVQFTLAAGWFNPGNAFNSSNKETARQVIGSMKVTF